MKNIEYIENMINNMQLADFNGSAHSFGINYKKPLSHPPENIEQALSARRLAMKITYSNNEEYYQALWQHYWLTCCLSPKCDYIFAVLKELEIGREKDIMEIWERGVLWNYLYSDYGKSYYNDICIKFFLRRYNWYGAFKLWWKYNRNSFSGVNLLLPRLIGTIILGFIPLITATEVWQFPSKLYMVAPWRYWLLFGLSLFASWIYLLIECRNTIGKSVGKNWIVRLRPLVVRSFVVFCGGLIVSFLLSFFVISPLLAQISSEAPSFHTKLLFTSLALFIGIFIQVFWEEKTITEPL